MEAVAGEVGWTNRELRRRSRLARSGGDFQSPPSLNMHLSRRELGGGDATSPSWLIKPEYEEDSEGGDNAYERPVEDRNDFAYYYLDNARGQVMALLARDMQYGVNTPGEGGGEDQDKARILEYYKYNAFGSVTVLPVYDRDDSIASDVQTNGTFYSGADDIPGSGSRTGWDLVENTPLTFSDNNTLMTNRRNGDNGHAAVGAGYGRDSEWENALQSSCLRTQAHTGSVFTVGVSSPSDYRAKWAEVKEWCRQLKPEPTLKEQVAFLHAVFADNFGKTVIGRIQTYQSVGDRDDIGKDQSVAYFKVTTEYSCNCLADPQLGWDNPKSEWNHGAEAYYGNGTGDAKHFDNGSHSDFRFDRDNISEVYRVNSREATETWEVKGDKKFVDPSPGDVVEGTLGGAASGAGLGALVGGPVGAKVGAVGGGVVGAVLDGLSTEAENWVSSSAQFRIVCDCSNPKDPKITISKTSGVTRRNNGADLYWGFGEASGVENDKPANDEVKSLVKDYWEKKDSTGVHREYLGSTR